MSLKGLSNTVLLSAVILISACSNQKEPEQQTEDEVISIAKEIHTRVLTLDAHVDIEVSFITPEIYLGKRHEKLVTLPKMEKGEMDAVFFAVYTEQGPRTKEDYKRVYEQAMEKFMTIHKKIAEENKEKIKIALRSEDVIEIIADGKKVAMIGIENGYPIGEDLKNIKRFYDLGCRYITLSHNGHNQICDSNMNREGPDSEHDGISPFGREVIAEMNRLGMIVDISHLSIKSMLDVVSLSKTPVIASHACCRALCDVSRNLNDKQLLALKENGGVIHMVGINEFVKPAPPEKQEMVKNLREEFGLPQEFLAFFHEFEKLSGEKRSAYQARLEKINQKYPAASVKDFVDHIDHAVKLIGIGHVAISSDFYESGYCLEGWKDVSETFNITLELVRRGYTEEEIGKIWSGNLLRVWKKVELEAEPG